jgi:mono/diheme cytochrome c family protein
VKRVLKWVGIGLGTLVVVAVLTIFGVSEYRLRETFDLVAVPLVVPADSASLARGQHVFETRGCQGCHGPGAAGKVFFDEPTIARLVAPNVPKVITGYSDPELARLLRHGIRPDGRGVAAMPSSMFYHLDDQDLGSLIAYLRKLPANDTTTLPGRDIRILARVGLLTGQYKLEPRTIAHDAPRPPNGPGLVARGLYLAKSSCTECHGNNLQGDAITPALMVVRGYSPEEFARLMREGVPKDGRTLGLMAATARNRFSNFSTDEVEALYAYLSREPAMVTPAGN